MDLTKQPPRSARETFAGVMMAPRTTDKCRAYLAGTLGAYIYNCPLDQKLFAFLGTNAEEFADVVRRARGDDDVEAFVRQRVAGRSRDEIETWNRDFLKYEPDLSRPAYRDAVEALQRRAPGRPDITLWVHLIDIEEGRPVPTPEEVRALKAELGLAA
jgi:hypothetical protein